MESWAPSVDVKPLQSTAGRGSGRGRGKPSSTPHTLSRGDTAWSSMVLGGAVWQLWSLVQWDACWGCKDTWAPAFVVFIMVLGRSLWACCRCDQ